MLPEGTHEFHYDLGKEFFKNMDSTDIRNANLAVDLTVTYRNGVYDLTFACEGNVIFWGSYSYNCLILLSGESPGIAPPKGLHLCDLRGKITEFFLIDKIF